MTVTTTSKRRIVFPGITTTTTTTTTTVTSHYSGNHNNISELCTWPLTCSTSCYVARSKPVTIITNYNQNPRYDESNHVVRFIGPLCIMLVLLQFISLSVLRFIIGTNMTTMTHYCHICQGAHHHQHYHHAMLL
jgi:hypothetical protein